jgi:mannose-1-phosphate guanylyltransferase
LTHRIPKCLTPVNGQPLLAIWLDLFEREGITDVLLNVSHHFDAVDRFLASRSSSRRVRVTVIREPAPAGTATTVRQARDFVAGEENFWILYADNLTDMRLAPMLNLHRVHRHPITIGLFRTRTPRSAGIVELAEDGRVTAFVEKPSEPRSNLANAGVYLARQEVFDWIPMASMPTDFGLHVLPSLVGRMFGYCIPEFHADIGSPDRLEAAAADWAANGRKNRLAAQVSLRRGDS